MSLNKEHVILVAKNHTKYSIRGGAGLIFAIITLITGLLIGAIMLDPISSLQETGVATGELAQIADQAVEQVGRPAVKWATDASEEQLDFWLQDNPALISAFFILFSMFVPLLTCLGAFNQLSGDIGSRGIRYLLLRTERINLFAGRFIGTLVFSLFVYITLFFIMALFFVFQIDFYDKVDVLLWMLRCALIIFLYSLPFCALCAWISASIDSPFGSLSMSILCVGGVPLILWIAGRMNEQADKISLVTPWAYRHWLLDPNIGKVFAGCGIMFAFTAFFLYLGGRHLERRDL